jgi:ATP-dependent DNA helicase RecG
MVEAMEEGENNVDLCDVISYSKNLANELPEGIVVEYLHGKMKPAEKNIIMERFARNEINVLVSTTVIEVGVNVPNATVMMVEDAERFGLAGLHQLRGRVGRGEYQSYCILKYQGNSEIIRERMKVISSTNDGFVISEKDLELRGSGEFFGTRQHGIPEFKIANLFEDIDLLKQAQGIAMEIIDKDPLLENEKNSSLRKLVEEKFKNRIEI